MLLTSFYCGLEEPSQSRRSHKPKCAGAEPAPATIGGGRTRFVANTTERLASTSYGV